MGIGEFRHRIIIRQNIYSDDGSGGETFVGFIDKIAYAKVVSDNGAEKFEYNATRNNKELTILIRKTDITPQNIIIMDGSQYIVTNIASYKDKRAFLQVKLKFSKVTGG